MLIPLKDENPVRSFPYITILLILANVLVFIYQLTLSQTELHDFLMRYALIPSAVTQDVANQGILGAVNLTIISSMFLHGGIAHILVNMLYLWIFGNNVEDTFGHFFFLLFYLLTGAGGAAAHILSDPGSGIPTIGASGAISGILGGYIILFPFSRILTIVPVFFFIQIIRVPAIILIGFWLVLQLFSGMLAITNGADGGGVAWFAHIGGFIAGLILVFIVPKIRRPRGPYTSRLYR